MVYEQRRHCDAAAAEEDRGARHARGVARFERSQETAGPVRGLPAMNRLKAAVPGCHHQEQQNAENQRNPAAVPDLPKVSREERDIDQQEPAADGNRDDNRPSADPRASRRKATRQ